MKKNIQRCLYLALLVMLWPMISRAQDNFNDFGDVIFIDSTTAIVCSFDNAAAIELNASTGVNGGSTLYLGDFMSNSHQADRVYFFGSSYQQMNAVDLRANQNELIFGLYDPARSVTGLTASHQSYLNKIELTWNAVDGADGYLIFREDQVNNQPYAINQGGQLTAFTDQRLPVDASYTYYVVAYNLQKGQRFISQPMAVTGATRPFSFAATTDNEATVTFNWEFDNHLLLSLPNQSAYVEVLDNVTNQEIYGDEVALTDIAAGSLLFDNSLKLQGDHTNGVYAYPGLGSFPHWTLELWVNLDDNGRNHGLFDDGVTRASVNATGQLEIQAGENSVWSSANAITYSQWNHLAFTYDGSELVVYLNGQALPMGAIDGSAQQNAHPFAITSLSSQLRIGQRITKSTDEAHSNFNGSMGMIRMWEVARTPDQVAGDYQDLFDVATPGLLAQWTFDNETVSLPDNIHGRTLQLASTHPVDYPVRWTPAAAFINAMVNFSHTHWLAEPQLDGAQRSFTINMYETGTGKLISSNTDEATFVHPGIPELTIEEQSGSPHQLKLTLTPVSRYATAYVLTRENNTTGQTVALGRVQVPDYVAGDSSVLDPIVWDDMFAYENANSLLGGYSYTYTAVPYYANMDHRDDLSTRTVDESTDDFNVEASAAQNGVSLTWSAEALATAGYDMVRIERNGEILKKMPAETAAFNDSLMLYGVDYQYSVVALKEGLEAFMQVDDITLQPNGSFEGVLVASSGDFVLRNQSFQLLKREENGIYDSLGTYTSDIYGAIAIAGIPYEKSASFELVSLTGKGLSNNVFKLTRDYPNVTDVVVKYDTALTEETQEGLLTGIVETPAANSLQIDWTVAGDISASPVFTNVYRDGKLLDIVRGVTAYTDVTGTPGAHDYQLVSYYFNDENATVQVAKSSDLAYDFPAYAPSQDFTVSATSSKVHQISWQYPGDAPLQSFFVTRKSETSENQVAVIWPTNGAVSGTLYTYELLDLMGYPGRSYDYHLYAIAMNGDTVALDTQADAVYPALQIADVAVTGESLAKTDVTSGAYFETSVLTDTYNWPSWDGFVMYDDHEDGLIPLEKSLHDGNHAYTLYHPGLMQSSGNLGLALYKHTDEGLFISDTLVRPYSNATFKASNAAPAAPTLLTSQDGLPNPVLSASRDVKGNVFVEWNYPHYTEMSFHLSKREHNTSDWTTIELSNGERAYLDENTQNKTMEYKLQAVRFDGETSDEVWAYGVSREYIKVEGYVFDQHGKPLPGVFVGVDGQWTLSDGAGHYVLADLELVYGNFNLAYVIPGSKTVSLATAIAVSADQDHYRRNIHINGENETVSPDADMADIHTIAAEADNRTFTNKIRWKATNDYFTGFKVYKGIAELATIGNGEEMIYVDSLKDLGSAGFTYSVVPFYKNAMGAIEENTVGGKSVDVDFPVLEAPAYADAYADPAQGVVRVTWSHERNNVDGYIIERNDEEVGRVSATTSPVFIDSTGVPNQVYRYNIYSYLERSDKVVKSLRSHLVEATFPLTGIATDLVAVVGKLPDDSPENYVEVSWEYPSGIEVDGAALYRGLDSIAYVSYPENRIIDSLGVPETYTTYYVKTYDEKDGTTYASKGQPVNIVFPKLQVPVNFHVDNVNIDTVWLNWEYYASGVDAFELFIINHYNDQMDTVVHELIENTATTYQYLFNEGISGVEYIYGVRAVANRDRQTYYSVGVSETLAYPELPTPELSLDYTNGEQHAVIGWGFGTKRNDGFKLTIKNPDGTVYEGSPSEDSDVISYDQKRLPYLQRSHAFIPNFNDLGATYTVELEAFQDAEGAVSKTDVIQLSMNTVGSPAKYPTRITASTNNPSSVMLNWEAPGTPSGLAHYVIYRDGERVITVSGQTLSFEDRNTSPGVTHVYQVEAKYTNDATTYARTVKGMRLGDGLISAQIVSTTGTLIAGDSLIISAVINGEAFIDTAYSDQNGNVYFRNLAYAESGIAYHIRPAGDLEHYDTKSNEVLLDYAIKQNFAGSFINNRVRTINGVVKNSYCSQGCGRDSVLVNLYGVDQSGAQPFGQVKTNDSGAFSFAIPYYLDDYQEFYLEVANESTGSDGRPLDSISYQYLHGENITLNADSSIRVTFSTAYLEGSLNHEVTILDVINHPLRVNLTGAGDCNVLDGYEFLLKVSDQDNKFEEMAWTDNRGIGLNLPPYVFNVQVLDVDKPDAFSQKVLDYFKSRSLTIDNKQYYREYLQTNDDGLRDTTWYLRYNERTSLAVQGLDAISNPNCSEGKYRYILDAENEGTYPQSVVLTLKPVQTINGETCEVTTGYILPKFPGGSFNLDTIRYDIGIDVWQPITLTGTTPNLSTPYTQLLEFYYYDASGNFQGSVVEEILVVGKQSAPGRDVFIVPESDQEALAMVPLYVLRDPPGDKSSAFISEKSIYSFTYERAYSNEGELAIDRKFSTEIGPTIWGAELGTKIGGAGSGFKFDQYTLEFKEGLSTVSSAKVSENVEGYLDGPDADIIVGASFIMSYGIVEKLELDGNCEPLKGKTLEVNPNATKTSWAYTRSQIENTVNYYNSLIYEENGNYHTRPGVQISDAGSGNGADIANRIGYSKNMFENVLNIVDKQFTPTCEMCEFAKDFEVDNILDHLFFLYTTNYADNLNKYAREIRDFCSTYILDNSNSCKPMKDLIDQWDDYTREEYAEHYRKYLVIKDAHTLNTLANVREANVDGTMFANGALVEEFEELMEEGVANAQLYEPLENITFGAGAKVTRNIEKSVSTLDQVSSTVNLEFSAKISTGAKYKFDASVWFGFGGGTVVENGEELNGKIVWDWGIKYKHKSTISSSEFTSHEFKTGFTLNDDDDGDHFSVDVFHSWTDGATKTTPYFNIVGGRSACPYEPGTIPRDMPRIQLADEEGNLQPTAYYDLDPSKAISIPLTLTSGNLFGEGRLVQVTVPLGTNKNGIDMKIEGVRINNYRGSVAFIDPDEGVYHTAININKGDLPYYDFDDIELVVKPNCYGGKGTYWEEEFIYDTVKLELHYRKPISPVTLESDMGSWFVINDQNDQDDVNEEAVIFKIKDYDVEQSLHSMKEVYLEYKKENEEYWTKMRDFTTGLEVLSSDTLLNYYQQSLNTYPDPLYPFTWDISSLNGLSDGTYQVRATVVHEKGNTAHSNILTGTIDRTAPGIAGYTAPTDGLLSLGDEAAVSFDESIDCESFWQNGQVTVTIKAADGINDLVLPYNRQISELSAYELTCGGSGLSMLIDADTLEKYDTKTVEVRVSGIKDYLGNASDPKVISWSFRIDYHNKGTSPIRLIEPTNDWVVNIENPSITFMLGEYDLYELTHVLDSVVLEYSGGYENIWHPLGTVHRSAMVDHYEAAQTNPGAQPTFPVTWTPEVSGATYEVRAVAYGAHGTQEYSNHLKGTIDMDRPYFTGNVSPEDDTIRFGTVVEVHFTEAIAPGSLEHGRFEFQQLIDVKGTMTAHSIQEAYYLTVVDGDLIKVYFDDEFTASYDSATVVLVADSLTDLSGNRLSVPIEHIFSVRNVAAAGGAVIDLGAITLSGDRMMTGAVAVNWTNSIDNGVDHYVVERSVDGQHFSEAATVPSTGTNDYELVEFVEFDEVIYYRVKKVAQSGEGSYSRVIAILDGDEQTIPIHAEIFPNPIEDNLLNVRMFSRGLTGDVHLKVIDMKGALIHSEVIGSETAMHVHGLQLPGGLEPGVYMLHIIQEDYAKTIKFIKR